MWELSRTRHGSFLFDTELCPVCGGLGRYLLHHHRPSTNASDSYMPQYQPQYTNYGSKDKHGENNMLNSFKIFKNKKQKSNVSETT